MVGLVAADYIFHNFLGISLRLKIKTGQPALSFNAFLFEEISMEKHSTSDSKKIAIYVDGLVPSTFPVQYKLQRLKRLYISYGRKFQSVFKRLLLPLSTALKSDDTSKQRIFTIFHRYPRTIYLLTFPGCFHLQIINKKMLKSKID